MLDIVNEPQRSALAIRITEDSLLLEAGLDVNLSLNATAGVSYSGQLADGLQDNAVKGRLIWLF